jgi:hypothetical protein
MTFHSFIQRDRTVIRNLADRRHALNLARDFRRSAWLHADPQNPVYQVNWSHAQEQDLVAVRHEHTVRARIIDLLPYIGPQPRDWRHDNTNGDGYMLLSRRRRFTEVGNAMGQALRDEDGEYFLENVWRRLENHKRLRGRLLDIFRDATSVDFHYCDHCDHVSTDDDDWSGVEDAGGNCETWCPDCTERDARYSDLMNTWISDDDAIPYYDSYSTWEDRNPDDYVTERWVGRRGNVYLVDSCGGGHTCAVDEDTHSLITEEDRDEDSSEPDVNSYHSGVRVGHIPSQHDRRKQAVLLGIELEFEFNDNEGMHEAVNWVKNESVHNAYCVLEKDGSLAKGFEAITGHTGLDQHDCLLRQLLDPEGELVLQARTGAKTNGTHIHVSKLDMTVLHQTKLATFIYADANRLFIEQLAGRRIGGDYCRNVDYLYHAKIVGQRHMDLKRSWPAAQAREFAAAEAFSDWSRYGALSLPTSTGTTVEFRLFRGSTDFAEVMAWAEFAFAAWHFSQQQGTTDMTVPKFIQFVYRTDNRCDTKHLRKYLQEQMNDEHAIIESRRYKPAKVPREQLALAV